MEVIRNSGYRPNMAAKSLRDKMSRTIGIIVPNINNELFSEIVLEIEKFFFEKGYSTFICNTNQDSHKEITYFETLGAKQVDGIICISGMEAIPSNAAYSSIPVVCIDRKPNLDSDAYYVESDHYIGGFLATQELIRSGARKILILSKANSISVNRQRLQGYRDALAKYGIPVDEELIVKLPGTRSNFEEARDTVNYLLAKGTHFDGIFGTNDWRAYGALSALLQNGVAVPKQVKIVGFDAISVSEYCTPSITTIYQDKQELALNAAQILYGLITKTHVTEKRHIVIPVSLIKRATT